ncbi:MAG: DUF799 family lipoprotein [Nitrospiraceae bacterium]|nr:MAG: DUF799 family lipoprotein [Nitrospiraceae bacterium]
MGSGTGRKSAQRAWFGALLFLLTMVMALGCGGVSVKRYIRPAADISAIESIAVLPLSNYTTDTHAAEKIRNKIGIELLSRGYNVIEPGEVMKSLGELKIRSVDDMGKEEIVNIAGLLNADGIITGDVEVYGISDGIVVSYPEVSIHLRLFDSVTGNVIWSVGHTNGGPSFWTRHLGAEGRTLDAVSEQVIREAVDQLH